MFPCSMPFPSSLQPSSVTWGVKRRPGRSSALSKISTRLVPARTTTPVEELKPSISTNIWFLPPWNASSFFRGAKVVDFVCKWSVVYGLDISKEVIWIYIYIYNVYYYVILYIIYYINIILYYILFYSILFYHIILNWFKLNIIPVW